MKKVLLSSISLLALAGSAFAADLPARMPAKAAYVSPAFNWTGFYAGVNLGGSWSDGSGTVSTAAGSGPITGSGSTLIYGGQIGYNWQPIGSSWVFGLETDIQGTASDGSFSGTVAGVPFTGSSSVDYFGTFRGRIGYAWDRTMLYFTGGGVYGKANATSTGSIAGSASATYLTWTIGGGLEYALLNNWSVKGEYLYIGTPDDSPLGHFPTVTGGTGDVDTHVLRAGLNYRF